MKQKKIVRIVLGAGMTFSFGLFGGYVVSTSTTMGTETELAGMSYTLDQYCSVQTGANQTNPEAIIAFEDMSGGGEDGAASGAAGDATPETIEETVPSTTPKPESEYANVGISIAADYVNIRKKPSTDSTILGKLYRGSAATIMKDKGDWVYIKSGSVSGYIMKDYLAIGYSAEKLIDEFGTKWATVTTDTLKVREEENTDCRVLTLIPEDESYEVLSEHTDWARIRVDADTTGYVSKDYVNISVQFKKAVSIEEEREAERRKAAAEAAEREREREREREEEERRQSSSSSNSSSSNSSSSNSSQGSSSNNNSSSGGEKSGSTQSSDGGGGKSGSTQSSNGGGGKSGSTESSNGGGGKSGSTESSNGGGGKSGSDDSSNGGGSSLGSGDGSAIASYGLQFVGNPYVWGGTSLTHGTDCSGFTQSVFAKFGISLPRTSREQSGVGRKISASSARAGDLIFYASGGRVNHVALCIGGGRIVHASNPRTGITTSNMWYRTPYCARRVLD